MFISEITGNTFTYYIPSGSSEFVIVPTNRQFTEIEIDENANFKQVRKVDKFGISYEKEISFVFPDFATVFPTGNYAILFKTNNEVWHIAGYDFPMTIGKYENETGDENGESVLQITLESKSYNPVKQVNISDETQDEISFPENPAITGATGNSTSYYYGKVNVGSVIAGASRPTANESLVLNGTEVNENSDNTISITFGSSSTEYCWFAIPQTSTNKTVWYVDSFNQGSIGGSVGMGGNLFPAEDIVNVAGTNYRVYITNYATEITSISFLNS